MQTHIDKFKAYLKQGYSKEKALNSVEKELLEIMERQKDEARIIRGAALAKYGDSYLDRAQKVAELESEMKLNRFVRDMPKYERSQKWLDDSTAAFDEEGNPIKKDTLEEFAFREGNEILDREAMYNYEPAMYKIVNDP